MSDLTELEAPEGVVFQPGEIRVSSINVIYDGTLGFYVMEIDCYSKYARIHVVTDDEEAPVRIGLYADEHTLRIDKSCQGKPTRITLPPITAPWEVIVDGGRYVYRVVAWQRRDFW